METVSDYATCNKFKITNIALHIIKTITLIIYIAAYWIEPRNQQRLIAKQRPVITR